MEEQKLRNRIVDGNLVVCKWCKVVLRIIQLGRLEKSPWRKAKGATLAVPWPPV
jgi:hypothetical protein